jgi:hypothetical protein
MNPRYAPVAERAAHRCEYCRAPEAIFNFPFEVEHIVPTSRGGPDQASNWALSCRACNLHKGDHQEAIDPQSRTAVPLFHPRRHRWADHFDVEENTAVLVGLTPTGRATIDRLQMNRPTQLAARRQWMRLKLFPTF